MNSITQGHPHTICFYIDDLKSSHIDKRVNDRFAKWLNKKYGTGGKVTIHQGKVHGYLRMTLNYCMRGKVKINMEKYLKEMVDEFPQGLRTSDTAATLASESLFEMSTGNHLSLSKSEALHHTIMKGLFASK